MNTVEKLIDELKKHPRDRKVFIEFGGSINFNQIELEVKDVPEIVSFDDGDNEILVIKPKV